MGLQESNQEICARMAQFVQAKPLSDKELLVSSDYADAAREDGASKEPGWFAAKRGHIEQQLKGNVLTMIGLVRHTATALGLPAPAMVQTLIKSPAPIGSEAWRRSAVRRHLLRHALGAALQSQPR